VPKSRKLVMRQEFVRVGGLWPTIGEGEEIICIASRADGFGVGLDVYIVGPEATS
jgi:hypothetical protein